MKSPGIGPAALVCALACILFLSAPSPSLQAEEQFSPEVDALERSLEMGGHERLAAVKSNPENMLNEFTTDGCSGGLSVGWTYLAEKIEQLQETHGSQPPWESCCVVHDTSYHVAGDRDASAEQSFNARKQADIELRSCVLDTGVTRTRELSAAYDITERDVEIIYSAIAELMYRAVRIGGVPCSPLPWRWGYGWPECD